MRSLLTRLAALSVVAVAVAGCAGSSGTALPIAGPPNSSQVGAGNSQPNLTGTGGTGGVVVPANTIPAKLIDDGTKGTAAPAATYAGVNVTVADTQSATNSTPDAQPAPPAQPVPTEPSSATDAGSHLDVITNISATQAIIRNTVATNLTYSFGGQTFDYGTLVAHLAFTAGSLPASVSVEFTGGSGTSAYDVRATCTPAAALAIGPAFTRFTCAIPAYGVIPALNTTGPNAIVQGAAGVFTPNAATVNFVLNYTTIPAAPATVTVGIDNVYATQ